MSTEQNEDRIGTVYVEDMEIGMSRSVSKVIGDREIEMFAELSTDHNPVHLNEEHAKESIFGGRIAHGIITAGLISAVLGERLPGHGSIYLKQSLTFCAPVRPGDKVTANVTVSHIDLIKRRVTLDCRCYVGDTLVVKGESLVLAPSRKAD